MEDGREEAREKVKREKEREQAREKVEKGKRKKVKMKREKVKKMEKRKEGLVEIELSSHVEGERICKRIHQIRPDGLWISYPGLEQFEQGALLFCGSMARQELLDVGFGGFNHQRAVSPRGGVLGRGLVQRE